MTKWGGQPGGGGHCGSAGPCSTWVRTWVCALAGVPARPPTPDWLPGFALPGFPLLGLQVRPLVLTLEAGPEVPATRLWSRRDRDSPRGPCPRPLPGVTPVGARVCYG